MTAADPDGSSPSHEAAEAISEQPHRGRGAGSPWQIPLRGWKDILARVRREVQEDRLSLVAAGITYYEVIALFPALIALVSIYGLLANPTDVVAQVSDLSTVLPSSARHLLLEQLTALTTSSETTLSIGLLGSIAVALWSASSGVTMLLEGINTAYDEPRRRSFIRTRLVALAFALGGIFFTIILLSVTGGLAYAMQAYALSPAVTAVLGTLRWVVLAAAVLFSLAMCYRYGPYRAPAKLRWTGVGTVLAGVLWLAATALFGFYVQSFGKYNRTYGALASGVVLMVWLYLTNFIILLGAEVNAEIEAQTALDSTTGPPKAMGQRGAIKADELGPTASALRHSEQQAGG